ncbi:MAG: class I SAM-dependent methyltransferase [bacterium]|nr:class I SAM-dependent methyltransferase [bacterium]
MLLVNKIFEERDFRWLPAIDDIDIIRTLMRNVGLSPGWDNSKAWEISMIYEAVKRCYVGTKFLDIGAGQGILPVLLSTKGYTVTCIDTKPVPAFVEWSKQLSIKNDEGTIFSLPYPDSSFDAVTSVCVLEHIASFPGEPERWAEIVNPTLDALMEIARVLKTGGLTSHTVDFYFPETKSNFAAYTKRILLELFSRLGHVFKVTGKVNYDVDIDTYFLINHRVHEPGEGLDKDLDRLKQGLLPEFPMTKAIFTLQRI